MLKILTFSKLKLLLYFYVADRENFFEALKKVYTLKKSEGRELYGEKFKSSEDFLLKHLNGAGTSDCDHWHDGPAIVTLLILEFLLG